MVRRCLISPCAGVEEWKNRSQPCHSAMESRSSPAPSQEAGGAVRQHVVVSGSSLSPASSVLLSAASLHASPPVPGGYPHPCITVVASLLLSARGCVAAGRAAPVCCGSSLCCRALRCLGYGGLHPQPPEPCGSLLTEASQDSSGSRSTLPPWLEFYCCSVAHIPRDFSFLCFFCRPWMRITPSPPRACWGSWVTCCLGRAWTCCWQRQQRRAS